ncbi:nucleoside recognition domain-containing protein [Garciella nitratireducens]|uniref:Nucleoside recognition n=1 Tax=Garciella nitratireducens DSM 15102 TaxID=1121911 RepID=A0A1T4K2E5_9FIRM|nr:nucleoside recognition domain-containing protein [Garciella nitratireducens]RBP46632.1 nucleoside recognition protein [Garciella nitratireducens]SJZ36640.1 Nucleoside recognition [Garciella nitratireducens DSM 15102]
MLFLDTSIIEILKEGLLGAFSNIWKMVYIIIPLMIMLEIAKYYNWVYKIIKFIQPLLKKIGFEDNVVVPLLIGVIFGLLYGSGVMIDSVEEGEISKKDITLVLVFLVICHSIFEDTFLFSSLGVNFFVLFFARIAGAVLITYFFSRVFIKKNKLKDLENIKIFNHEDSI